MATRHKTLVIGDLRGGRNGADAPLSLPDTQCVEALNVDFWQGTLGRKRNGASLMAYIAESGLAGYISSLFYGASNGKEYFCAADTAGDISVLYGTIADPWVEVTGGDAALNGIGIRAASINDRTYVCYQSAVNRLHYLTMGSATMYRVGLSTPSAPTAANVGGGVQWPSVRSYKVAWLNKSGATITERSELSASVTFTPAPTAGPVLVTRPAVAAGENVTDWEVYGAEDGINYVLLSTVAIATTTYSDAANPTVYAGDAAPVVGTNTVPGAWKFIATDGNRLIGAGNYITAQNSRVWFTPVQGALDIGDMERVPLANYIDIDPYDGAITGIVGSFMGNTVIFKDRAIARMVPTGDSTAPYKVVFLTKSLGCIAPESICVGEDENGSAALYFLSHRGPYRIGTGGLEYCGRDIEDLMATVYQSASVIAHATWHQLKHQLWLWVATGTSTYPNIRLVLDTQLCRRSNGGVRGGWTQHTGASCTAICSMGFGATADLDNIDLNQRPYAGSSAAVNRILRCDEPSVYTDYSTAYQAYVKTKPYALAGLGHNCSVGQTHLVAAASDNATITQTIDRDFGAETRISSCSLTAENTETRVQRQFEGSDMAGAGVVQFQLGDAAASSQSWTLDALMVPYLTHEER